MLELLSPAGSMEALRAAVQNGADAVYLGYGNFNARRNAKNFSEEEFAQAVSYCHLRGCRLYLTLNTLVTDREMEVLRLMCKHMTTKEIARELFISENAVKYHKMNMLGKTGFSKAVDLAFYMISNGWINPLY